MRQTDKTSVDRRSFLRAFGTSTAGAAAAASAAAVGIAPTAAEASESKSERTKKRYRETDHVKSFYRTNRY